jgi:hypothetical protein
MYLHRSTKKLVQHGGSYNGHFQLSSDLLWHPDMDDGGLRLDMVEEAIENPGLI